MSKYLGIQEDHHIAIEYQEFGDSRHQRSVLEAPAAVPHLIEREQVGGTCVNVGCMPTKTTIASARVAHRRGQFYRPQVGSGVPE